MFSIENMNKHKNCRKRNFRSQLLRRWSINQGTKVLQIINYFFRLKHNPPYSVHRFNDFRSCNKRRLGSFGCVFGNRDVPLRTTIRVTLFDSQTHHGYPLHAFNDVSTKEQRPRAHRHYSSTRNHVSICSYRTSVLREES